MNVVLQKMFCIRLIGVCDIRKSLGYEDFVGKIRVGLKVKTINIWGNIRVGDILKIGCDP